MQVIYKEADLLNSSPQKLFTTDRYSRDQDFNTTRLISSPIRTSALTGGFFPQSNLVATSPYRTTQASPIQMMPHGYTRSELTPARVLASPGPVRLSASPGPVRAYGSPIQPHSYHNYNLTHSPSPVRTPYQAPIYAAPAYQQ